MRFNFLIDKESYIEFDKEAWAYFGTKYARNEAKSFISVSQRTNIINSINMIYIYSDICSYQYVGDTYAPLLNIVAVPCNVKFGDYVDINYSSPHYIPIISKVLDKITMRDKLEVMDILEVIDLYFMELNNKKVMV